MSDSWGSMSDDFELHSHKSLGVQLSFHIIQACSRMHTCTHSRSVQIDSGLRGLAIEWLVSFVEKRLGCPVNLAWCLSSVKASRTIAGQSSLASLHQTLSISHLSAAGSFVFAYLGVVVCLEHEPAPCLGMSLMLEVDESEDKLKAVECFSAWLQMSFKCCLREQTDPALLVC